MAKSILMWKKKKKSKRKPSPLPFVPSVEQKDKGNDITDRRKKEIVNSQKEARSQRILLQKKKEQEKRRPSEVDSLAMKKAAKDTPLPSDIEREMSDKGASAGKDFPASRGGTNNRDDYRDKPDTAESSSKKDPRPNKKRPNKKRLLEADKEAFRRAREETPLPSDIEAHAAPIKNEPSGKDSSIILHEKAGASREEGHSNHSQDLVVSHKGKKVSPYDKEVETANREKQRKERRIERERKASSLREKELRAKQKKEEQKKKKERRKKTKKLKKDAKKRAEAENLLKKGPKEVQEKHWSEGVFFLEKLFQKEQKKKKENLSGQNKEKNKSLIKEGRRSINRWKAERASKHWKDVVGLDIGAYTLRASKIKDSGEVVLIERDIPEGIIVDGLLQEPEELSDELRELFKEGELDSSKVNFSVANRLVTMRTKSLPAQTEEDIEQALALNAGPIVSPMKPEDTVIDYNEMSRIGPRVSLQVAAADMSMANDFMAALEDANLVPIAMEIGPLAVGRSIVVPRSVRGAHLIIDIGAETTKISVASGPDIFFLYIIERGGNDFTRALAGELGLGWSQAEEMKIHSKQYLKILQPEIDRICQEVVQAEALYKRSYPGREVEGIFLLGGGSRLHDLDRQMGFLLKKSVTKDLVPWPGFEGLGDSIGLWTTSLGLARGNSMSLLPTSGVRHVLKPTKTSKISPADAEDRAKELLPGRKEKLFRSKTVIPLILIGVLFAGFLFGRHLEGELESKGLELKALEISQESAFDRTAVDGEKMLSPLKDLRSLEKNNIDVKSISLKNTEGQIIVNSKDTSLVESALPSFGKNAFIKQKQKGTVIVEFRP